MRVGIGIVNAQGGEEGRLARFHAARGAVAVVVVALQVQHAVNDEVRAVIGGGLALLPRFPPDDRHAQHQVARQGFHVIVHERQHVRGVGLAAVLRVETLSLRAPDEPQREHHVALVVDEYGGVAGLVTIEDDPQAFIPLVLDTRHSRFPVIGENKDDIVGILLAKELLNYYANPEGFNLRDTLRPAVFVPESKRLNVLLRDFRANRNHMAIVVDEYGGVSGLVTIEDVLEQIVGDIEDEYDFDESEDNIVPEANGRYRVKAQTEIADFNTRFGTDFSDDEFDTVGGLVLQAFGRLPKRSEATTIGDYRFRVVRADSRRLYTLQLVPLAPPPGAGAEGAARPAA